MKCIWRIVDRKWRVSDRRFKEGNVRQSGQSKYFERIISRVCNMRTLERAMLKFHVSQARCLEFFTLSLIVYRKLYNSHVLRALTVRPLGSNNAAVLLWRITMRTTFISHLETVTRRHNRFGLVIHRKRIIDEDKYELIPLKILCRPNI